MTCAPQKGSGDGVVLLIPRSSECLVNPLLISILADNPHLMIDP